MQINKDQCPGTMLAFIWGNQTVRWKGADLRDKVWGVETTRLFHHKETRCLQLPIVPNEFGVCMVYGRCCTRYDGARHTWVSRHFCPVGIFWSPEFLCVCFLLPSRIGEKEHGIPTAAMECLFLYCLGLAGKGLISEAWSHDLLPSTI